MYYVVSKNYVEVVNLFIRSGVKINKKDGVGCMLLYWVVSVGYVEMCEVLLEVGVDVEVIDWMG